MTLEDKLYTLLKEREGIRNDVYRDSEGKLTVGYGHLVTPEDGYRYGDILTDEQIRAHYDNDSAKAIESARAQAAEAGIEDEDFLVSLSSVNYQLGTEWRNKFFETWPAIKNREYERAANLIQNSLWMRQTPKRAQDFQTALRRLAQLRDNKLPPLPPKKPSKVEKKIPIPQRKPIPMEPIDTERALIANMDDSVSTEKTITVEFDDGVYNIPTIHEGIELEEEVAIEKFIEGEIDDVGKFDNIEVAEKAAKERSKMIGEVRAKDIAELREEIGLPPEPIEQQAEVAEPYIEEVYQDVNPQELPPAEEQQVGSNYDMYGEIGRLDLYARELFGDGDPNDLEKIDKQSVEFVDKLTRMSIADFYDPDIPEDRDIDFNQVGVRPRLGRNQIGWIDQFAWANKKFSAQGIVTNAIQEFFTTPGFESTPNYNVMAEPDKGNDPAFLDYIADAQSHEEYVYKRDLWNESKAEDLFFSLGVHKGTADAAAIVFSAENLLPVALPFKGARASVLAKHAAVNLPVYGGLEQLRSVYDPTVTDEEKARNAIVATGIMSILGTALNSSAVGRLPRGVGGIPYEVRGSLAREFNGPYHGEAVSAATNKKYNLEAKEMADEEYERLTALAPTGIGIEKIALNPKSRLENSLSTIARMFVREAPGSATMQVGHLEGKIGNPISVNTKIINEWHPRLGEMAHVSRQNYMLYKQGLANESVSKNAFDVMMLDAKEAASAMVRGGEKPAMTFHEWNRQLTRALFNKDTHHIKEIQETAQAWRKHIDWINDQAIETDMYVVPYKNRARALQQNLKMEQAELNRMTKTTGDSPLDVKDVDLKKLDEKQSKAVRKQQRKVKNLERRLKEANAKIDELRVNGPSLSGARSYFGRYWRKDKIMADKARFIQELAQEIKKANPDITMRGAIGAATKAAEEILHEAEGLLNSARSIDDLRPVSNAIERTLNIDDFNMIHWLEDDAESIMRSYVQGMAVDVEFTRQFGDYSLRRVLDDVNEEYDIMLSKVEAFDKQIVDGKLKLTKKERSLVDEINFRRDRDLEDIRAIRDLMRGTYGIGKDPYSLTSKAIRTGKQFNILTMLGGAAISSIPDTARVPMTEGFAEFFGIGLGHLTDEQSKIIRKMSRDEMLAAGEAWDMVTGWRALQFADVGDPFGQKMLWERQLADQSNLFFMLNGLNFWNSTIKEFAGVVISNRMIRGSLEVASGKASDKMKQKMLMSHVDEPTAKLIAKMYKKYGQKVKLKNGKYLHMPNTAKWIAEGGEEGLEAAKAFRAGLVDDVQRTIVTPGPGEKALWTSREFGSLLAQFQSFAQASTSRVLVAGLQGRDAAFMHGALALAGMGMVVNEFKREQNNIDTPQNIMEKIARGLDRSGIYAVYGPMSNVFHTLTNNQLSLTRMASGAEDPVDREQLFSTFGGPTGFHVDNMLDVSGALSKGNIGDAASNVKDSLPYNNHWLVPQ